MRKIYLVRHGQSTSNAGGDAQLNAHVQLTTLGHQQAQEVAQWLIDNLDNKIDSVSVSEFVRTHETAQPLVDKIGVKPHIVEGLHEFDYLSFKKLAGHPFDKRLGMANAYWKDHHPDDLHGEDAESFRNFYNRVAQVMAHFKTLPVGNHAVYTHGLWISMFIWQILGQPARNNEDMRRFREFEKSIRAKNCEVFRLTLAQNHLLPLYPPAITKVRLSDHDADFSTPSFSV